MNKITLLLSASIVLSASTFAADEPSGSEPMHDKNGPCKADVEQHPALPHIHLACGLAMHPHCSSPTRAMACA